MNKFTSRDEQMTQDVATMAALGRFEKEFTAYGCVFLENEHLTIAISENAEKIYDWMYSIENKDKLTSTIHSVSLRSLVPAGMEKYFTKLAQDKLIESLKTAYHTKYFLELQNIIKVLPTNQAFAYLEQLRFQFDGICNQEQLALFEGLIEKAFRRKVLNDSSYYQFSEWIRWTKRDLDQQFVKKDKYEKNFFAFYYTDSKQLEAGIIIDGNKANTYKKFELKLQQGYHVSNIITKKWWYNNSYSIVDAKRDCKKFFEQLFDNAYRSLLIIIETLPTPIQIELYNTMLQYYRQTTHSEMLKSLEFQGKILQLK